MQNKLFSKPNNAVFSVCRKYRYTLRRKWGSDPHNFVNFIGLNPSTADETNNDPTVRRCIDFAQRWRFDALVMTNLFAWRSTSPLALKKAAHPIGIDNDKWLLEVSGKAKMVVAAWGIHGPHLKREEAVLDLLTVKLHCFGTSKAGNPKHPLYLRKTLEPIQFSDY